MPYYVSFGYFGIWCQSYLALWSFVLWVFGTLVWGGASCSPIVVIKPPCSITCLTTPWSRIRPVLLSTTGAAQELEQLPKSCCEEASKEKQVPQLSKILDGSKLIHPGTRAHTCLKLMHLVLWYLVLWHGILYLVLWYLGIWRHFGW